MNKKKVKMKIHPGKIWLSTFNTIIERPIVLAPFIIIAFFECLFLEIACFCTRKPLVLVFGPVLRKFFGEQSLHYPANILLAPNLFYYFQIMIYIFVSVLSIAISVNIFHNVKENLPIKANAVVRNAFRRYGAYLAYGIIFMILVAVLKPFDEFVFSRAFRLVHRIIPGSTIQLNRVGFTIILFLTNFFVQAVFIASVPFMVLEKKPLFKAILSSMVLFFRNFFTMLVLVGLPLLVYMPVVVLKSFAVGLTNASFPGIVVVITILGIIGAIFIDCFAILCASQVVIDALKNKNTGKAA
jgi:hypothetical protein